MNVVAVSLFVLLVGIALGVLLQIILTKKKQPPREKKQASEIEMDEKAEPPANSGRRWTPIEDLEIIT